MIEPQIAADHCTGRRGRHRRGWLATRLAVATILCGVACVLAWPAAAQTTVSRPFDGERIGAGEAAKITEIVALNLKPYKPKDGAAKRDQHPKHHGLVKATFTVRDDIPASLRSGVFASAKSFDAVIRYSNGRESDDTKPDAHGMAIKLMGVPGPKLQAGAETSTTHDFILVDSETFFLKDIDELMEFNGDVSSAKLSTFWGLYLLAKLKIWRRDLGNRVFAFAGKSIASPLAASYWSAVPYRLGTSAVKYMVRSPKAGGKDAGKPPASKDGLAAALKAELAARSIELEFGAFVQTDPQRQPIEDPTVSWQANGARYVALATIKLHRQDVDAKSPAAEKIAFSPWNVGAQHQPLGAINRARRAVYRAMSERRHRVNKVDPARALALP